MFKISTPRTLALLCGLFFMGAQLALAASGDLSLSDADLTLNRSTFLEGQTVRITANVANLSGVDLYGSVRFTANGNNISSDQPLSALANNDDAVFVDWRPVSAGEYTIVATVLPLDSSKDNPGNNRVQRTIVVGVDTDRDGIGNGSDNDDDNDGVADEEDLYPLDKNEQRDSDGDGQGDTADTDDDNDGVLDAEDAFPIDPLYSKDLDKDGLPDENDDDMDGDQLLNNEEDPLGTDPMNPDTDGDTIIDGLDPFPLDPSESKDTDGDGVGDNKDEDIDGDGSVNQSDADPQNPAPKAHVKGGSFFTIRNREVNFDASGSEDDSKILEYSWTFNDESFQGESISTRFEKAGLVNAKLTITDENGQSDSKEFKIHVIDPFVLVLLSLLLLLLIALALVAAYRYNRRALKADSKKKKS